MTAADAPVTLVVPESRAPNVVAGQISHPPFPRLLLRQDGASDPARL